MKFFSIPSSIAIATLFWAAVSQAKIEIQDLRTHLHYRSTYNISWISDRDYVSCKQT